MKFISNKEIAKLLRAIAAAYAVKNGPFFKIVPATSSFVAGVAVPSAAVAGFAAPWVLKGSEDPVETVEGAPASTLSPGAMAGGAAAGALAGGLGSLLYGKLKKEPNLRRDVVMALVGATAGTAVGAMVKTGHQIEFEHEFPRYLEKQAWVWPVLAGSMLLGSTGLQAVDYAKNRGSQKRQAETTARTEEMQQQLADAQQQVVGGQKALYGAGVGAVGGAAGMGFGSAAYGKLTGKENIRRDLVLALLGAVSGGVLGSYAGSRQQA